MTDPAWESRAVVLALHERLIAEFGGDDGLRDAGLLESALARPLNLTAYGKPSLFERAASYAFGIARNQSFVDGNKRTALVTSFTFLELNGHEPTASEAEAALIFVDLAAGKLPEKDLARWMEANCVRRKRK